MHAAYAAVNVAPGIADFSLKVDHHIDQNIGFLQALCDFYAAVLQKHLQIDNKVAFRHVIMAVCVCNIHTPGYRDGAERRLKARLLHNIEYGLSKPRKVNYNGFAKSAQFRVSISFNNMAFD
jgi:hypothetical protein